MPTDRNEVTSRKNHSRTRVFITGVSGFLGAELAERLVGEGYDVSGLVRKSSRPSPALERLRGKIEIYEGDLTDQSGLRNILRSARPEIIVHYGAISPVSYSFDAPIAVMEANLGGTIKLAEAARIECPNLKLFAYASSVETLGIQPVDEVYDETKPVFPNAPYACFKLAAEYYLKYLWQAYKFPSISFRQVNCYGRKDSAYFITEAVISQALQNDKEINLGRGEPIRAFIHLQDLMDLYSEVIGRAAAGTFPQEAYGDFFCTGPANGLTIRALAEKITELMDWKGVINFNTREIRAGEIPCLNASGEKLDKVFGWRAKIRLEEGLKMTIDYWRSKLQK